MVISFTLSPWRTKLHFESLEERGYVTQSIFYLFGGLWPFDVVVCYAVYLSVNREKYTKE